MIIADNLSTHTCEFFAAVTTHPKRLRRLVECWYTYTKYFDFPHNKYNPFERVLISPTMGSKSTVELIKKFKDSQKITTVMFDSGGYSVKTGRLTYSELYAKLSEVYNQQNWADVYILPDNPPLSQDSKSDIDRKVKETVEKSLEFSEKVDPSIQNKLMPVIHGRNQSHIEYCIKHYEPLLKKSKRVALGSFAISNESNTTIRLTAEALNLIRNITLSLADVKVHNFGIGSPPSVLCLAIAGIKSFDTASYIKSGANGSILLPFMSNKIIASKTGKKRRINRRTLEHLKSLIGHRCPFCEDYNILAEKNHLPRTMHNLVVLAELNFYHRNPKWELLKAFSYRHYKMIEKLCEKSPNENFRFISHNYI